jgi:hypothetical protein
MKALQRRNIFVPVMILAAVGAVLGTTEIALAKKPPHAPGGGGGSTFETVPYWVSFSSDPLIVFWSHDIAGRIENPDNPRILVNRNYGGERAHIQPKQLRLDDDFAFVPGANGGDDFDVAFPDTTYDGTLIISGDGTTVSMEFTALSRAAKKQHYMLTAYVVDTSPAIWDPLAEDFVAGTITLGLWELEADTGSPAKAVQAWGDFNGETQITVDRQ